MILWNVTAKFEKAVRKSRDPIKRLTLTAKAP